MPLRRVRSFLALALLASPALAFGQGTGIIRGRVTDAATGAPLGAVQVRVDGTAAGAQTGPDGTYTITGAPAGSRVLSTRRLGYAPERITVTIPETGAATQDFALDKVATPKTLAVRDLRSRSGQDVLVAKGKDCVSA